MKITKIEPLGLCPSAKRMIDLINKYLSSGTKVCILGDLLHNSVVNDNLKSKGALFIDDYKKCPKDYILVLPAHGTKESIKDYLIENNIKYIDTTCKNVLKIHEHINNHKNDYIIFIGKKLHAEAKALGDYKNVYVVEDKNDVDKLDIPLNPVIINQTTFGRNAYKELLAYIESKCPMSLVINTECLTTSLRGENVKMADFDILVVVGDKTSSNANELLKLAKNGILVNSVTEINEYNLKDYKKVAIASATSTPNKIIDEIINYLEKTYN